MGQRCARILRSSQEGEADDVKRQIDNNDDSKQKPIYQLIEVKSGGGKLIDIIKSSAKCSSQSIGGSIDSYKLPKSTESSVDKQIYDLVKPLLYNDGHDDEYGSTIDSNHEEYKRSKHKDHRWVCWKLEERGFVGETALHICFLLSTPTTMILARKLLAMFPMLINDIYNCDQYFGESCLHMAIVNENFKIVKLLLDHGANVHERCLGSFFLPNDQKDKANTLLRRIFDKPKGLPSKSADEQYPQGEINQIDFHSNSLTNLETNYDGYAYWGEYPLSFAVCLGLVDCYKLLLAKGANPNKQDSNGNTSLHMAVVSNKMDMFDLCYSSGADLNILNKQNLSVLTLAAKLRRVELFFHIVTIRRKVNWVFCGVGFVEVPLIDLDSIDTKDGSCNEDSVLSIVVFGGSNEHLQMLDGLLSQLLTTKWEIAVRGQFYRWLGQFMLFLLVASLAYISRFDRTKRRDRPNEQRLVKTVSFSSLPIVFNIGTIGLYSEFLVIFFVIYYLLIIMQRIAPNGFSRRKFLDCMLQAPEMSLFVLTCLLILSCIPLRIAELNQAEDFMAALVMLTLPLKLLFFCRASRNVGSFVVMIYKIVVNDVLCFVVFLLIFVAGFSQSFSIIFRTHRAVNSMNKTNSSASADPLEKNYFINLFDGVISMHVMALNEFSMVFDEFDSTDYPKLARFLFCIYMTLASILLINMLIAMLDKTYQDIASQPNENLRQWARALLLVERMWSNKDRLRMLRKYSHYRALPAENNSHFYGSTWVLKDRDKHEIRTLQELNADNEKNAKRLEQISPTVLMADTMTASRT